jgi:chromosomal replication initiator protein
VFLSFVATDAAEKIKAELAARMPGVLFDQWFARAEIDVHADGAVRIGVQNRFFKSRIETAYLPVLAEASAAVLGDARPLSVVVSPRLFTQFREEQEKREEEAAALQLSPDASFAPSNPAAKRSAPAGPAGMDLSPGFTFDTFVPGAANRLSHAVALRMVESGGEFGRAVFCGQHGVGKTHLLQAVCRAYSAQHPDAVVTYTTCGRFVADFVAAHAEGSLREFRASYRACDLLAIDQLQELAQGNKSATQTELLALLDELQARGKAVLLASTLPPSELDGLEPRLRDRLGAGFIDKLSLPDESMRSALLVRKLAERNLTLPEHLVTLLAQELSGNVRRLEGVVSRLTALLSMWGMEPSVSCMRMALEMDAPSSPRGAVTPGDIVAAVAAEYGLSAEAVTGRGRALLLRRARQVALVLCRRLLGTRYAELGQFFSGRSHATVMSAIRLTEPGVFSSGVEGRPVERILFRLGVSIKPEELLERQGTLFPRG